LPIESWEGLVQELAETRVGSLAESQEPEEAFQGVVPAVAHLALVAPAAVVDQAGQAALEADPVAVVARVARDRADPAVAGLVVAARAVALAVAGQEVALHAAGEGRRHFSSKQPIHSCL
jgi:hypothetical protein